MNASAREEGAWGGNVKCKELMLGFGKGRLGFSQPILG